MARRGEGHLHPNHPSQVERGVPPKEGADVASLRAVMQAIEGCVTQANSVKGFLTIVWKKTKYSLPQFEKLSLASARGHERRQSATPLWRA